MEWLMSPRDVQYWIRQVSTQTKPSTLSSQQVLNYLKRTLVTKNLYIGPATFTSGFISVLHEACYCDHVSVVKYVLDHHGGQFDINQLVVYHPYPCFTPNECQLWQRKQTLVHAAIENSFFREERSPKLLKLLVSHGSSVNIPDCCSVTPLLKAVSTMYSCKEIISSLLKARADIHYRDIKGQTVLMYAVSGQADKDIISMLLKAGADPTLTDERGYTVLHHAVHYGRSDHLRLLLSLKIPPTLCPLPSKSHAIFLADRAEFLTETDFLANNNREQYSILTAVFAERSHFPWDLKIDSLLVNASCKFYLYRSNRISACCDDIKEALTLKAQLKLPPPTLSEPIEAYGDLTEITSIEEYEEKYSDLTNISTQVNLAYQCLIIRERCLGYGDSTVIKFLFGIGKWMISIKYYAEGLLLWLRATEMLTARFQQDVQCVQSELKNLIENGYSECSEIEMVLRQQQPDFYRDMFIPILRNLIECQRLSIDFYTYKLHHRYSLYDGDFTNNLVVLVEILQHLFEHPVRGVDMSMLCHEAIEKCPTFPAVFPLHSNLLDCAMSTHCLLYEPFLSLLLESGGYMLVNDVGLDGLRPLEKADSKEVTSLLLAHGAHLDAVSRSTSPQVNPFLDDYISGPFLLTCLSAKYIVMESIPYQLMDLPRHIKYFIGLHDPDPDRIKND